jgi:hypothetical protein
MADKDFRVKNGIHVGTDVFISNAITRVNTVNFATNGFSGGNLTWNTSDGTLDINLGYGDVVLQTGQETHYVVRNATGSTILNGTSVYCDGVTEGSGRFTANLMLGDGSISPVQYLGLATHDINNGVNGIVTHFGYVRGLDTRGTANTALSVGDENWSVGDKLYVHPTAPGKLTKVEPEAPNAKICVAVVIIRNASNGKLFVRPTTNLTLDKLSDIQLNTIADGQTIVWNSANSRFEAGSAGGGGGDVANAWVNANDWATLQSAYANDYSTLLSAQANDGSTLSIAYSNDYSTLLTAYANDYSTLLSASANDYNTLITARSNDYNTYTTLVSEYSANDGVTLATARGNDHATLLTARANDYNSFTTLTANIYNTFAYLNANVSSGGDASNIWVNANDFTTYTTLQSEYRANDGITLATARGNDHVTLLTARANDFTTFNTLNGLITAVAANVGGEGTDSFAQTVAFLGL